LKPYQLAQKEDIVAQENARREKLVFYRVPFTVQEAALLEEQSISAISAVEALIRHRCGLKDLPPPPQKGPRGRPPLSSEEREKRAADRREETLRASRASTVKRRLADLRSRKVGRTIDAVDAVTHRALNRAADEFERRVAAGEARADDRQGLEALVSHARRAKICGARFEGVRTAKSSPR